jgi:hypothetical protein
VYKSASTINHSHQNVPALGLPCPVLLQADTPYMYSTYDGPCESAPTTARKVLILGGGPNRIGQGIEFDYCCCHASFALRYGLQARACSDAGVAATA